MAQKEIKHNELVRRLMKSGSSIMEDITPFRLELIHMIMGISGEAGELLDAVKKHVIYNKDLDFENVIEELGDIEFFMEGARQVLNISREECLAHNIKKLSIRYGELTYTDKAAKDRVDKSKEQQKP